jgi:hypothetical protein
VTARHCPPCARCHGTGLVITDAAQRRRDIAAGMCGRCGVRPLANGSRSRCEACENWDGRMRSSTMRTRYHVGRDAVGLLETFSRKGDAFNCAIRVANKDGLPATVYDSLARHGCGELWTVHPGITDGYGSQLVIPPTRRKT